MSDPSSAGSDWRRTAVIYQVYPRSFAAARDHADGVGDLQGITRGLPTLRALGVDAIWLSPFYPSPQADAGYDVADYTDVDPRFGTLGDFDALLAAAHGLGMRVVVDLVPNHSSDEHPWFQAALRAGPGSPERARYIFRDGKGPDGDEPPNNWPSEFGGPGWQRVTEADGRPGQWYLHLFDVKQPDFDWTNPEVRELFRSILRFWLDRGVDGFRIDVATSMMKKPGLPNLTPAQLAGTEKGDEPRWERPEVHEIFRDWRTITDSYSGQRMLTGEAWVQPISRLTAWVRPDELHQTFNFPYEETAWDGPALRAVIDESLSAYGGVGAPATWVLSNHDVIRHATRLSLVPPTNILKAEHPPAPDPVPALRRGRAATALMLALPGSAYLYQGEELGLPEVLDLPNEVRQDPTFFRTGGRLLGRDGCRVPIPWEPDAPGYGFSPDGASWLPQPDVWRELARSAQEGDPSSTVEFYRAALALREAHSLCTGVLEWDDAYERDVLVFRSRDICVVANTGTDEVDLPDGEVLLSSWPLESRMLPPDTTAWLRA